MKCVFNLYKECIVLSNKDVKNVKDEYGSKEFIDTYCILCIKSYRLKRGLKTVVVNKGVRTGVTL